jgi:hypothetical protein
VDHLCGDLSTGDTLWAGKLSDGGRELIAAQIFFFGTIIAGSDNFGTVELLSCVATMLNSRIVL